MGNSGSTSNKCPDQGDHLQLALYVLPIVKELAVNLRNNTDPLDKRYGYLSNVDSAATLLEFHLKEIEKAGNANTFMGHISKLADLLDEIFNDQIFKLAPLLQLSQDTPYRRLRAVQKLIPKNDGWQSRLPLVPIMRRLVDWDGLQRDLIEISDELQRIGDDAPSMDKFRLPSTRPDTAGELMVFADRVLSVLSCNECESESQRKVRLRIGAYRSKSQDQQAKSLCVLLAQYSSKRIWHEAAFHNIQQSRRTPGATRFAGREEIEATPNCMETWYLEKPNPHPCICNVLKAPSKVYDTWRLNIVPHPTDVGLQNHKPNEGTYRPDISQEEKSLKSLLAFQAKGWEVMTKYTLALILSYSLFYLYGGSWAKGRWSRKNIVFFGDGEHFPLRPFLSSDPQKLHGPFDDPEGLHQYPEILELGVILLEIHLGQTLESYLGLEEDISEQNELLALASKTFKDKEHDIFSVIYRDAIKKCLQTDFSISGNCNEQILRESLFKNVVEPLEEEVKKNFRDLMSMEESLDEYAEQKINLGSNNPGHRYSATNHQRLPPQHQKIFVVPAVASPRPAYRYEFEIGIICALTLEYDAIIVLMDEIWDDEGDKYGRAAGDLNTYTTGRIGKFNVVLMLSGMGKASATRATTNLRSSFSKLRLVLLTGICGGVPSSRTAKEIVLGDVVLSASVVQYDFGSLYSDKFVPKDTPEHNFSGTSRDVHNMLDHFVTEHGRRSLKTRAAVFLEELQRRENPRAGQVTKYQYPGAAEDKLFQTTYTHKHRGSLDCLCTTSREGAGRICEKSRKLSCDELHCDEQYLVQREKIEEKVQLEREGRRNEAQAPAIFIGNIGSGDMVVKSGENRDRIAKIHDLVAFEMEAAGVWDGLPCLVIKGICDYADSHKNKVWQHFAAATAASVTKAVLERYTQTDKHYI